MSLIAVVCIRSKCYINLISHLSTSLDLISVRTHPVQIPQPRTCTEESKFTCLSSDLVAPFSDVTDHWHKKSQWSVVTEVTDHHFATAEADRGKIFPGQGSRRCHMLGRLSHGLPLSNDSGFEGRAQFLFTTHPLWEDATHLGYQFPLMRSASLKDDQN